MIKNGKAHPILWVLLFYFACFVLRGVEYLAIRTDQSVIGEAFIHKLLGIALLAAAVWVLRYRWADIGFRRDQLGKGTLIGLLLGVGAYVVAYGAELLILAVSDNRPSLQFYVTSYGVLGNRGLQDGVLFVLICVVGNLINVVMEEGVFRGLFLRVLQEKHAFALSCVLSSLLFGLWHIAQPVRNVLDGAQSVPGAVMSALLLVTTSTLLAIQYCMLFRVTGSIWAGMAAHFINNASVNLLHVSTAGGVDEMQTLRIAIAQSLSFVVVLVVFIVHLRRSKRAQRTGAV